MIFGLPPSSDFRENIIIDARGVIPLISIFGSPAFDLLVGVAPLVLLTVT